MSRTPSPWTCDPIDAGTCEDMGVPVGSFLVVEAKEAGETIATVEKDAEVNARLIAAAPDLLAVLKVIVDHYGDPLKMARAAIAKAEGR